MINTIAEKVVSSLRGIVPIWMDEKTTRSPYAVYEMDVAPSYTKGGIYKYSGTLDIKLYGKTFDTVDAIADDVRDAIAANMRNEQYRTHLVSEVCDETADTYIRTMSYVVAQYSVPLTANNENSDN